MQNTLKVVLDPKTMEAIAYTLKNTRTDYYLYVMLVYHTCTQGLPLLDYTVKQMEQFCKDNSDVIPASLMKSVEEHTVGKKKSDYFFSASRNHSQSLSKRTIESVILKVGKEYGYSNFGIKTIVRTSLYNQFRQCGYDFNAFRPIIRKHNRFFTNVSEFLDYCGLTVAEYEEDVANHTSSLPTLNKELDFIIKSFKSYKTDLNKSNVPGEKYSDLVGLINKVSVMVEAYTNLGEIS